jgi:nitroimidazol reductase NimA-like FMN-containing flavoprotein (pyridoxamine 5'-phosphate oxidase superfamily)
MDAATPRSAPGAEAYRPTARAAVKRLPKRGHYDHATVHEVLDAGVIGHVGYAIDGQPFVTPTAYWREGSVLYWHGSSASRMLRHLESGLPACLAVSHLDGFVMARAGFHHSINYRSVMAFGTARLLADPAAKLAALEAFVARLYPGRWDEVRPPSAQEMKATKVIAMEIEEASAKIRSGPPVDDEEDYALPVWSGVIPVTSVIGPAVADPRLATGAVWPQHLGDYAPGTALDDILARHAPTAATETEPA